MEGEEVLDRKRTVNWSKFQDICRRSSVFKGFDVHKQKHSTSTNTRPDFVGYSRTSKERIVADSKWKVKITLNDVKQVSAYKGHPNYASKGVIFCPNNAEISNTVREEAKSRNIQIIKKRVEKVKERPPSIFGIFQEKRYLR